MGKFGNRRLPKFIKSEQEVQEVQDPAIDQTLDETHPVEIVSLGDHGNDHAMIIIRTKDGEELELKFDYDGNGMLVAQHGDHEYAIPVEIEVVSDDEVSEKLTGKQKALDKNKNGKLDADDFKKLRKPAAKAKETDPKASITFENFVNECWTPMQEGYNPGMSEEAKRAVKAICEDILINEARECNEDGDPNHTYENYLNEVGQYFTDCMMESAASIDVDNPEA
jgi:molecular chaperone DnaK (HSP70)